MRGKAYAGLSPLLIFKVSGIYTNYAGFCAGLTEVMISFTETSNAELLEFFEFKKKKHGDDNYPDRLS